MVYFHGRTKRARSSRAPTPSIDFLVFGLGGYKAEEAGHGCVWSKFGSIPTLLKDASSATVALAAVAPLGMRRRRSKRRITAKRVCAKEEPVAGSATVRRCDKKKRRSAVRECGRGGGLEGWEG